MASTDGKDKITGFLSNKIDDAKYQLEARQRKFEISAAGSKLERKKAKVKNWLDKEVVTKKTKDGSSKMTGEKKDTKQNENEFRRDVEGDGCDGAFDFDCNNPCGLFST